MSDVRLTTVLVPGAGGRAGVVLRWTAADEHYRVVIDGDAAAVAVVSVRGGVPATLWSGTCPADPSGATLAVEAIGERIRVDIDGIRGCEIQDGGHAAGLLGVVSGGGDADAGRALGGGVVGP